MKRLLLFLIWITLLPLYGFCQTTGDSINHTANQMNFAVPIMTFDGLLDATGTITGATFYGDGSALTGIAAYPNPATIPNVSLTPSILSGALTHPTQTTAVHGKGDLLGATEQATVSNKVFTGGLVVSGTSAFSGIMDVSSAILANSLSFAPVNFVIDATADVIPSDNTLLHVSPDADYVLSGQPTIASASFDGKLLILYNDGSFTFTIQDESILANSGLDNGGGNLALAPEESAFLFYESGSAHFHVISVRSAIPDGGDVEQIRNTSGATLAELAPVYETGWYNPSGIPTVALSNYRDSDTMGSLFVTTGSIANNANGFGVAQGMIQNVSTSAWSIGDSLYVLNGYLWNTAPTAFDKQVRAVVIRSHPTQGVIYVFNAARVAGLPWNGQMSSLSVDQIIAPTGGGISIKDDGGNIGIHVDDGGNVGIGTDSPQELGDISGVKPTLRLTSTENKDDWSIGEEINSLDFYSSDGTGSGSPGVQARIRAVAYHNEGWGADLAFYTSQNSLSEAMRILHSSSGGNVGIGTTSPQNVLDVEGDVAIGASYSGASSAPSNGLIVEGDVGIGTTGADSTLTLKGSANNPGNTGTYLQLDGADDIMSFAIGMQTSNNDWPYIQSTNSEPLFINPAGNNVALGGTTNPSDKFSVYNGYVLSASGFHIGADSDNNLLDDASNGSGTTVMYIGNESITTSISAGHKYKIGEAMETGDAVVVEQGGAGQLRIKLATNPLDPRPMGIVQMIPSWIDSTGDVWVVESTETVTVEIQGAPEIVPQASAQHVVSLVRSTTEIIGSVTAYSYSNGVVTSSTSPLYATEVYQATELFGDVIFNSQTGGFTRPATSTIQRVIPTGTPLKAKNPSQEANEGTYAYKVIMYGDTYEEHTNHTLHGAKLSVHNGSVGKASPVTISDATPGWLMLKTSEEQREIGRFYQDRFNVQAGPLVADTTGAYLLLTENIAP